jgi:hypothetical protein
MGLILGSAIFLLGGRAQVSRLARAGFIAVSGAWTLVVGTVGLILAGLWMLTDHTAASSNENVLQASLITLALLPLLPGAARQGSRSRQALVVAWLVTALSMVGLLLKLFPPFYQVNGEIIALALPIHLGVAGGIARLTRRHIKKA